jgi:hypothetical protein
MPKEKNKRNATRRHDGANAWICLDGGFALRACYLIDYSETGVRIEVDASDVVPSVFNFMKTRGSRPGRRARIKWRRGTQIGAEFIANNSC